MLHNIPYISQDNLYQLLDANQSSVMTILEYGVEIKHIVLSTDNPNHFICITFTCEEDKKYKIIQMECIILHP